MAMRLGTREVGKPWDDWDDFCRKRLRVEPSVMRLAGCKFCRVLGFDGDLTTRRARDTCGRASLKWKRIFVLAEFKLGRLGAR